MNAFTKSKSNQLNQSNPFKKSSPIIQSNEQKRVTDRTATATLTSHSKQEARYLIDLIANGIQNGDLFRGKCCTLSGRDVGIY